MDTDSETHVRILHILHMYICSNEMVSHLNLFWEHLWKRVGNNFQNIVANGKNIVVDLHIHLLLALFIYIYLHLYIYYKVSF